MSGEEQWCDQAKQDCLLPPTYAYLQTQPLLMVSIIHCACRRRVKETIEAIKAGEHRDQNSTFSPRVSRCNTAVAYLDKDCEGEHST